MYYYNVFGLKIQSELMCPFLVSNQTIECCPDVYLRLGSVRASFSDDRLNRSRYHIQDTKMIIYFHGVARFLIEDGKQITVDVICDDLAYISLFILGPVMGALLTQRNCFVIRGTSMTFENTTTLYCAKECEDSEMSIALLKKGYQMLSDHFSVLDIQSDKIIIYPGYPLLKLDDQALLFLEMKKNQMRPIGYRTNKYYVPIKNYFCNKPQFLSQIILLTKSKDETMKSEFLSGVKRLTAFLSMNPNSRFTRYLNREESNFVNCTTLMNRVHMVRQLEYSDVSLLGDLTHA